MNELKVFEKNGQLLTDSREVAKMIGKEHFHLMRDISSYMKVPVSYTHLTLPTKLEV